jgi:hypothetical protein
MLPSVTLSNSRLAAALAVVVMALSVSTTGQVSGTPPRPAVGTGLIAGQVVDVDTGRGVPGAVVVGAVVTPIVTPTGRGGQSSNTMAVVSDSQGRFVLTNAAAGTYTLISPTPGYTSAIPTRSVPLEDGARVTDVKISLRKLVSVSGRVMDDSGTPAVNVEMLLLIRSVTQGRPPFLSPAARTRTDDRGDYRFAGVAAGDYLVCACLRDPIPFDGHLLTTLAARPLDLLGAAGRAVTAGSDAVNLDASVKTLPITFYPGVTLASQAERVRVAAGEDKTGVDLTMTAVRAARVSGRIVGATSSVSAAHLRLRVMTDTPEAAGITQIVPMLVQPDGRFDFANVPPGQYVLEVNFRPGLRGGGPSGAALAFVGARGQAMQPAPAAGQRMGGPADAASAPLWAQELISVGDRDVTGLVIPLNRTVTVAGRVTFSGSAAPPTGPPRGATATLSSVESGSVARSYFGQLQADYTFQMIGVLPGRYVLAVNLATPPWVVVKSVTTIGADLTEVAIEIGGSDIDLNVTVTDTTLGSLSGRVAAPSGGTEEPTWVRVFPTERRFWPEPYAAPRRFRTTTVMSDGTFTLPSLPAGEYFLIASTQGGTAWMDAQTMETLARTAERVRVNDGDKLVVEVRR